MSFNIALFLLTKAEKSVDKVYEKMIITFNKYF